MLLAALLVGLLAAYYFGVRAGMVAAVVAVALFLGAAVLPGAKLVAYALVAVAVVGICWIGPKRRKPDAPGLWTMVMQAKRAAADLRKKWL